MSVHESVGDVASVLNRFFILSVAGSVVLGGWRAACGKNWLGKGLERSMNLQV